MKKIILSLALVGFVVTGLQSEALAHPYGHHSDRYVVKHKKVEKHNKVKNHRRDYRPNRKVVHKVVDNHRHYRPERKMVYKVRRPYRSRTQVVYTYPPTRYVSYYEPFSFGFGYSDFSSGYHFQIGFD